MIARLKGHDATALNCAHSYRKPIYWILIVIVLLGFPTVAVKSDNGQIAGYAVAFREAGVLAEKGFIDVVNRMPGSGIVGREAISFLWRSSFSNMIVKLGRLQSPGPVSLYYDPLLDIAVLVYWIQENNSYRIKYARALPGEMLSKMNSEAPSIPLTPSWMTDDDGMVTALIQTTTERLTAFNNLHPADAVTPGHDSTTFATAAENMRVVLYRLIWIAEQHTEWTKPSYLWLNDTLANIESVLAKNDPQQILWSAPDTDAVTADALAELPQQYTSELGLDMVLGSGDNRIVMGSSSLDGDIYVIASCVWRSDACELRRFVLVSLLQ